jgi:hypothetical protein
MILTFQFEDKRVRARVSKKALANGIASPEAPELLKMFFPEHPFRNIQFARQ